MSEIKAKAKGIRVSPQKARLVADQIRGLSVSAASNILVFSSKKSSGILKKLLDSAVANAEHNYGEDIDLLKIKEIYVTQGMVMKRFRARAKGRGNRILKPTCHVTITLSSGT